MKVVKIAITFLILSICCTALAQNYYRQSQFLNLLNIEKGTGDESNGYFFSDLGNWHGYGFGKKDSAIHAPGLRGPAFVTGRSGGLKWLSESFEGVTIQSLNGTVIPFTGIVKQEYFPGMLRQTLRAGNIILQVKEIAVSNRTTMMAYTYTNVANSLVSFKIKCSGQITYPKAAISKAGKEIEVSVENGKHHFNLSLPSQLRINKFNDKAYTAISNLIQLRPGASLTLYSFTSFCPYEDEFKTRQVHIKDKSGNADALLKNNAIRWDGYINKVLKTGTPYFNLKRNRNWAVKAIMTLNTNWRSAAGNLKHGGVVPATNRFDAFWAWDSWEHAVALALFNPQLAKDQMRTMFDFQTAEGMIIDLISADPTENNTKCSKPPIAGWGAYMVFRLTKDTSFVKEMFPKLLRFHQWRYKYRDHDQNGLCEYGGTGPSVAYGQWESGMDVAVKFDSAKILKNAEDAYSMNQESVELNSYLCAEKFYLSYLADIIGKKDISERLINEGKKLKREIQEKFFDKQTGYFYDRRIGTGELIKIIDISGWIPLFTGVATREQANLVRNNMLDTTLFGNYFPFSTLNHQHPLYNPGSGYFRGQTWMNYIYFGIRGFKNYNFKSDAEKYTKLIPDKFKGIADPGFAIRESYNSATGEGLDARHFSWSSAFSLLLLAEDSWRFPYILPTMN